MDELVGYRATKTYLHHRSLLRWAFLRLTNKEININVQKRTRKASYTLETKNALWPKTAQNRDTK